MLKEPGIIFDTDPGAESHSGMSCLQNCLLPLTAVLGGVVHGASLATLTIDTNLFQNGFAYDQSDDGTRVVGNAFFGQTSHAFLWTPGGSVTDLGSLGGVRTNHQARGISGDGKRIVGLSSSPSGIEAFLWTAETGMIGLGSLRSSPFQSEATAISHDGTVVVGYSFGRGFEAFRWSEATGMIGLGDLPGGVSVLGSANGVNADGSVVVGYAGSEFGQEAFRWTAASGMIGLGDLPGGSFRSEARAVSADGKVIVGVGESATTEIEGFVWREETGMVGLGAPPAEGRDPSFSEALAISADGSLIGGGVSPGGAALWIRGGAPQIISSLLKDQGVDPDVLGWSGLFRVRSVERRGGIIALVGDGVRGGPWWNGGVVTPFYAELTDPETMEKAIRIQARNSDGTILLDVTPGQTGAIRIERRGSTPPWTTVHTTNVTTMTPYAVSLGPAESAISLIRAVRSP